MNFYNQVWDFFNKGSPRPSELQQGTVNTFNSINIPYNDSLLPSNSLNRQGLPPPGEFGVNSPERFGQVVQPFSVKNPQNIKAVKTLNNFFLNESQYPQGYTYSDNYSDTSLQSDRPEVPYSISQNNIYTRNNVVVSEPAEKKINNYYVNLASESLHVKADPLMSIFFSDDNINHLRNTVVQKVKQITAESGVAGDSEGVTIKTPNMDDFFYYMVNIFQNHKIHNGSICFVNLKNNTDLKAEISKLNTNVLQEYVSKMISQINMYIYYYIDASQLPEQISRPTYTSMKGSKSLEYNTGFTSGNSMGVASYNEVGNI